jgi:hypothetical protein
MRLSRFDSTEILLYDAHNPLADGDLYWSFILLFWHQPLEYFKDPFEILRIYAHSLIFNGKNMKAGIRICGK